jgi:hypothetical protein
MDGRLQRASRVRLHRIGLGPISRPQDFEVGPSTWLVQADALASPAPARRTHRLERADYLVPVLLHQLASFNVAHTLTVEAMQPKPIAPRCDLGHSQGGTLAQASSFPIGHVVIVPLADLPAIRAKALRCHHARDLGRLHVDRRRVLDRFQRHRADGVPSVATLAAAELGHMHSNRRKARTGKRGKPNRAGLDPRQSPRGGLPSPEHAKMTPLSFDRERVSDFAVGTTHSPGGHDEQWNHGQDQGRYQ